MARWLALALAVLAAAVVAPGERPLAPPAAWAHPEEGDADGDGVVDKEDNCPAAANEEQRDGDGDGQGDACDGDDDADGVPDAEDRCPLDADPGQADADGDGTGDACEGDRDGDGAPDATDNCRETANPGQEDYDRDRLGDACDPDEEDDGVFDDRDNCPLAPNPDQVDADFDGQGRACDADDTAVPPPAFDGHAPRVRAALAAPARFGALGAGLPVRLRCSEACAATARLVLGRRAAARWGLGRARVVAAGSAEVAGRGSTYAFLRFTPRARRVLWRRDRVRLTLRVAARDRVANLRLLARPVELRR